MARPIDALHRVIELVLVPIVEFRDAPEDARGDARPEVGAVAVFPTAGECHATRHRTRGNAQPRQLLHQLRLQAARAAGEKILRTA